ncbi:MAG TPA: bifunctional nicotinamidase/pyrazinamidase [Opitutaceae bacterium]|nr:bifunctional nicotinamidase/pyrazinamidase [Opitutaceae bacterium]
MNALVLIDIQNDFLPGGSLAVREGDAVIPVANALSRSGRFDLVVATQDWHPANHGSFAANHRGRRPGDTIELRGRTQILWPAHCVQNTPGAELAPGLDRSRIARVFPKGTDPQIDSYSGFFDNGHLKATGLGDYLRERKVTDLTLLGLATDYCVKFTALDARQLGFAVALVPEGCRAVDVKPGDGVRAVDEMRAAGVTLATRG